MKNSIMADVEFASADFKKDDLVKEGEGDGCFFVFFCFFFIKSSFRVTPWSSRRSTCFFCL